MKKSLNNTIQSFIDNKNLQNTELQYSIRNFILEKVDDKIKISFFSQKTYLFNKNDLNWIIEKIKSLSNLTDWEIMTFIWDSPDIKRQPDNLYKTNEGFYINLFNKDHFFDKKWIYINSK